MKTDVVRTKSKQLLLPDKKRKSISKLEKGLPSILGDSAESIQDLLESGSNDSAATLIHRRILQTLIDVIPYAESQVRGSKGQKGVYAFNSLITSVRELLSDLQATKDRGALGDALVEKVVRPTFLDIGMALVQEEQHLATFIRDVVPPEAYKKIREAQRESVVRLGHTINKKYEDAKAGTISFLQS